MDQEIKKLWVEALRSGKYKQGKKSLRRAHHPDGYTYCCLGVLCDLAAAAGVGSWRSQNTFEANGELSSAYVPEKVRLWAKLPNDNPILISGPESKSCAVANDQGKSFDWIANRIEEKL